MLRHSFPARCEDKGIEIEFLHPLQWRREWPLVGKVSQKEQQGSPILEHHSPNAKICVGQQRTKSRSTSRFAFRHRAAPPRVLVASRFAGVCGERDKRRANRSRPLRGSNRRHGSYKHSPYLRVPAQNPYSATASSMKRCVVGEQARQWGIPSFKKYAA